MEGPTVKELVRHKVLAHNSLGVGAVRPSWWFLPEFPCSSVGGVSIPVFLATRFEWFHADCQVSSCIRQNAAMSC